MTILATIEGTLTVAADATPTVPFDLYVTDPDAFFFTLNVTERAAIAASQRHSALGIGLTYTTPDGTEIPFPDREIAAEFTISEDAERFGDIMTFKVCGERFSPFGSTLLRHRGNVKAEFVYGFGASEYRKQVFNGYVVDAPFEDPPPCARVTCFDAAAKYAERRAKDWILPANSNRTRLDITLELLGIGGISPGALNAGADGGGRINKAYAIGDETICSWLQKFWRVRGREVGFIDDLFVIVAYDPSAPSVATISAANTIPPYSLSAPDALAANVLGVVSVAISRTDTLTPGAPVITRTTVSAPYAPLTNVGTQNLDGTITPSGAVSTPRFQTISDLTTSSTKLGSVEIRYEEEEKTMYARQAAKFKLVSTLSHVDPNVAPYFELKPVFEALIFPDGSARSQPQETLQTTRRLVRTKTLDANNNVIQIREERRPLHVFTEALFKVGTWGGTFPLTIDVPIGEGGTDPYVTADGNGFLGEFAELPGGLGQPIELAVTDFFLTSDGAIQEERLTETFPTIGLPAIRREDVFGYGVDQRKYSSQSSETRTGVRVTRKIYARVDEDRYRATTSVLDDGATAPRVTTQEVIGALPRPERAEHPSTSQEIRALVADQERITYANGERIEVVEHNEFIQNDDEAAVYARYIAMLASAIRMQFTMPIEAQVHKWKTLTVSQPGSAMDGARFYVRKIDRDGAAFSQTVIAECYSAALTS